MSEVTLTLLPEAERTEAQALIAKEAAEFIEQFPEPGTYSYGWYDSVRAALAAYEAVRTNVIQEWKALNAGRILKLAEALAKKTKATTEKMEAEGTLKALWADLRTNAGPLGLSFDEEAPLDSTNVDNAFRRRVGILPPLDKDKERRDRIARWAGMGVEILLAAFSGTVFACSLLIFFNMEISELKQLLTGNPFVVILMMVIGGALIGGIGMKLGELLKLIVLRKFHPVMVIGLAGCLLFWAAELTLGTNAAIAAATAEWRDAHPTAVGAAQIAPAIWYFLMAFIGGSPCIITEIIRGIWEGIVERGRLELEDTKRPEYEALLKSREGQLCVQTGNHGAEVEQRLAVATEELEQAKKEADRHAEVILPKKEWEQLKQARQNIAAAVAAAAHHREEA